MLRISDHSGRVDGTVFAGGVTEPGAIAGHTALETARAMGAAIA